MLGHALNIAGTEWIIIVFVALVLILGTNKLPEAARKMGKAVSEYNRAKNSMGVHAGRDIGISGPMGDERQKFEAISRSIGIDPEGKTTDELRGMVRERIGDEA